MCPKGAFETRNVTLKIPAREHLSSYDEYIQALGTQERYPFVLDWDYQPFETWLNKVKQLSGENYSSLAPVPSSTFFAIHEEQIVGVTNIRHHLNDDLARCGGHVGLSIHPEFRNKGAGKRLLELSLEQFRHFANTPCHVHCHSSNVASRTMIERSGGKLHSVVNVGHEAISRYIFNL